MKAPSNKHHRTIRRTGLRTRPYSFFAQDRKAFVLILVLALLFASTLLLARMATHSIRLKSEAATSVESLQQDWAAWSTAHVLLPRSETLLTLAEQQSVSSASSDDPAILRQFVSIPGRTLDVVIFDLDARLNLNTLHEIGGEALVRTAVRQWIPDVDPDVRAIDPTSKSTLQYASWADVINMNDSTGERDIVDVIDSACSGLTCWGSGKLNLARCSDVQLLFLGKALGCTSVVRQIVGERRKSLPESVEILCRGLMLSDEDNAVVNRYLDTTSGCHGLILRCYDGGPELFLVKVVGSGAYRSRTLCFRLR